MNPAQARLCKKNISVIVAKIRQIYKSIRSTIKRALGTRATPNASILCEVMRDYNE